MYPKRWLYNFCIIFTQCTMSALYDINNGALPGHLWPGVKRSYISLLKKFDFTERRYKITFLGLNYSTLFYMWFKCTWIWILMTANHIRTWVFMKWPSHHQKGLQQTGKNLYIGDSCVPKRVRRFWYVHVSSYQKMFVMYDYFQRCNLWLNSVN